MNASPLNLCIAGIGGFAQNHHAVALDLERQGKLRLIATCDPRLKELETLKSSFAFPQRSVALLENFEEMMERFASQSHLISIATPIHFHAPMHAAVVSRRLGCYIEKPPTLDPQELEVMIANERNSDFQTEVGFNYIAEEWRQDLKRRILEGEWGEVRALSFFGAWNRDHAYYQRSTWAGKLMVDDRLVLDSCFGNAMSHHIHNLLFFAGKNDVFSWTQPHEVRAELYHAYCIKSADTVFSRMITTDGMELRVAMSHACVTERELVEVIHCERAEIRIRPYQSVEILYHSGKRDFFETPTEPNLLRDTFVHYLAYLHGTAERPLTGLVDCRPFVTWNALNYLAAQYISSVPRDACEEGFLSENSTPSIYIKDIEKIMEQFIRTGNFPSEQGVSWGQRGGHALTEEIDNLRSVISEMSKNESKVQIKK